MYIQCITDSASDVPQPAYRTSAKAENVAEASVVPGVPSGFCPDAPRFHSRGNIVNHNKPSAVCPGIEARLCCHCAKGLEVGRDATKSTYPASMRTDDVIRAGPPMLDFIQSDLRSRAPGKGRQALRRRRVIPALSPTRGWAPKVISLCEKPDSGDPPSALQDNRKVRKSPRTAHVFLYCSPFSLVKQSVPTLQLLWQPHQKQ